MTMHGLRRRLAAIAMVLGLGVALPFTAGVTPAFAQAVLSIAKFHEGDFPRGGQGVYTITVTNTGNESSGSVIMGDTLPAGLTTAEGQWEVSGDTDVRCVLEQVPDGRQNLRCTADNGLPVSGSFTVEVTVDVSATAPCSVTNTAVTFDLLGASDEADDPTTITGEGCNPAGDPALSINKSHTGSFTQGGTGAYTIDVSNAATAGPTTGTVTVTDTLPAGVTPTGASGTGWDCSVSGQTVTCTRTDALAAGASYPTITVATNVTTAAACTFTNTASVSGGGSPSASDNDPTTVTGGTCNGGNGGGGSILPVNLNGVIPMFNNISINNNIKSPGASNTTTQDFGVNAP
ncbi:hypothetical protein ACFV0T_07830 [Streptomyces sp. NPDC059582]|uniref:hypothetical protein n=1 Tax=Streptomyces sp. NPDC059582 TaxID=3346875 RepID=UPI0036A98A5E